MKAYIYDITTQDKRFNVCVLAHCGDSANRAIKQQFQQASDISYKMACEVILQNQEQVVIDGSR